MIEHQHLLWIGIWMLPYTVTPGKIFPDVGNLGQHGYYEMLHDDIVEAADHH